MEITMKNIPKAKENINETEIPLTIFTGCRTDQNNKFSVIRQQLERSALYTQSLFNAIASLSAGNDDHQADSDICNLTEIGKAFSQFVFENASIIYEAEQFCNQRQPEDALDSEVLQ
jgi:hypothetical protein